MPLTNAQYDTLMRTYQERQQFHMQELARRQEEIAARIPRIDELDRQVHEIAAAHARRRIEGDLTASNSLHKQLAKLKAEREALLASAGYPADYLTRQYDCPDCKDTGYIGNEKCHCFHQAAVNLLYSQSNLQSRLLTENFDALDLSLYSQEIHPSLNRSIRDYMEEVVAYCRKYAKTFGTHHENILFTGMTGVGKTFLSNCIAKAVLDRCHSVVYLTSIQLFEIFSKSTFAQDGVDTDIDRYILESELLIIDDLGTELYNSFTTSKLFYCINERLSAGKNTIISTNISPAELRDIYSERIASRLLGYYHLIPLFGEDIRIQKKFHRP